MSVPWGSGARQEDDADDEEQLELKMLLKKVASSHSMGVESGEDDQDADEAYQAELAARQYKRLQKWAMVQNGKAPKAMARKGVNGWAGGHSSKADAANQGKGKGGGSMILQKMKNRLATKNRCVVLCCGARFGPPVLHRCVVRVTCVRCM